MEKPSSYCEYVDTLDKSHVDKIYHDTQYGFPVEDDNELFGRLLLEINQAGLSWTTILKKQENFRKAYANFDVKKVSEYEQKDIQRLLLDSGIIRNKLKINAAIFNAKKIVLIQQTHGSFKSWLNKHHPLPLHEWILLFKKTFKFTGKEITNEFLMSTGYLEGAHINTCKINALIDSKKAPWQTK